MTYIVSTLRKLVHPSPEPSPRAMGITSSLVAESSSLPVELLLIIFQYAAEEHHKMESPDYDINAKIDYLAPILEEQQDLSSFTQVCQSWYYAGLPILYRIPYLHSVHHIHLLARSLRESQLYEGYVQGLFLGYIPRKTGTIHSWFGRSPVFKQLKSRIDASSLEEDLKFILTTCPHIDKLSLYHIKYPSSNPSDDYSEYVPIYDMMHWNEEQDSPHPSPTLPVIEKLQSLSICGKFSDGGELNVSLPSLNYRFSTISLQVLSLRHVYFPYPSQFPTLPTLQTLRIDQCMLHPAQSTTYKLNTQNLPSLKNLHIEFCYLLSPHLIEPDLLLHLTDLKLLGRDELQMYSDFSQGVEPNTQSKIRNLAIGAITNAVSEEITSWIPTSLEKLSIYCFPTVSEYIERSGAVAEAVNKCLNEKRSSGKFANEEMKLKEICVVWIIPGSPSGDLSKTLTPQLGTQLKKLREFCEETGIPCTYMSNVHG